MRLCSQMVLSTKEPRIIQDASDLRSKVRVLTTHQAWLKSGNYQQLCTALGAGNDAYELAKKLAKKICAVQLWQTSPFSSPPHLELSGPPGPRSPDPVQSPSQPWCLVCQARAALGGHSAEAFKLCWLHPIRSVLPFHILSGVVLPGTPLHPGVSEQVVLCHVLHLACGKKCLFSLLIPCYISFPPMVSESFLESSRSEIPPIYGISWSLWLILKPAH